MPIAARASPAATAANAAGAAVAATPSADGVRVLRAADLAPLLLRAGLAVLVLLLPLPPLPYPGIVAAFSIFFALGFLVRVFTTTLWVRLVLAAFLQSGGPAVNGELLGMAAMCTALFLLGAGPLSLDAKLPDRFRRLKEPLPRYAPYILRLGLALAFVTQGLLLLFTNVALVMALGAFWLALGLALALGFFTPWVALLASLAWLAGLRYGFVQAIPLALGSLALAACADNRIALDAFLARRGGFFPTVRREVVLELRR